MALSRSNGVLVSAGLAAEMPIWSSALSISSATLPPSRTRDHYVQRRHQGLHASRVRLSWRHTPSTCRLRGGVPERRHARAAPRPFPARAKSAGSVASWPQGSIQARHDQTLAGLRHNHRMKTGSRAADRRQSGREYGHSPPLRCWAWLTRVAWGDTPAVSAKFVRGAPGWPRSHMA